MNAQADPKLEAEGINRLLEREFPTHRKAYSDQVAWLMAWLSELAYKQFNPFPADSVSEEPSLTTLDKKDESVWIEPDDHVREEEHTAEPDSLRDGLKRLRLDLEATFDRDDIQAILVRGKKFIALAFRGTEKNSIKDIKTDIKSWMVASKNGGSMHTGFKEAFEAVAPDIQRTLNQKIYSVAP